MSDYERLLISKMLAAEDLIPAMSAGVRAEWFELRDNRQAWLWSIEYFDRYGVAPTQAAFGDQFPEYRIARRIDEPYQYYIDRLRDQRQRVILVDTVLDANKALDEGEQREAQEYLSSGLLRLGQEIVSLTDVNVVEDLTFRYDRYVEARERVGQLTGIPTGFPALDFKSGGWQKQQFVLFGGQAKQGKAQPLSAKVLTPMGWVRMGDVSPGSTVIGRDGQWIKVVAVHDWGIRPIYRVTADDGSVTECSAEHEWTVLKRRPHENKIETVETTDLRPDYHYLPMVAPVDFAPQDLPLDPYLVGALLGDGGLTVRVSFHKPYEWFRRELQQRVPSGVGVVQTNGLLGVGCGKGHANPVKEALKDLGLWGLKSPQKFIPRCYLLSSIPERLELLRGLMDTDGGMESKSAKFSTSSPQLADDFEHLVRSLGGVTHRSVKLFPKYQGGVSALPGYRIAVRLPAHLGNPFLWPEKAQKWSNGNRKRPPVRRITSVEQVDSRPVRCISVDSSDGLYVTDDFIVTHNSFLLMKSAVAAQERNYKVLFLSFEMSEVEQEARYDALTCGVNALHLINGNVTKEELEKLKTGMRLRRNLPDFIISADVSATTTVSALAGKVEQHRPDIVFVDGVYLMDGEIGEAGTPQAYTSISRGLKRLAQRINRPVIGTTQALSSKMKNDRVTMHALGWTSAWSQDADIILGVEKDDNAPLITLRVVAGRSLSSQEIMIRCNWDESSLEEVIVDNTDDEYA